MPARRIMCARRGCSAERPTCAGPSAVRGLSVERLESCSSSRACASGGGGRRVEPAQSRQSTDAPARKLERERRQVGLEDLRRRLRGRATRSSTRSTADSRRPARCGRRDRGAGRRSARDRARSPAGSCRDAGSKRGRRSQPPSITMRTPSIVRLVSARLVARISLRRPSGAAAAPRPAPRRPGRRRGGCARASSGHAVPRACSARAADLGRARQEGEQSPSWRASAAASGRGDARLQLLVRPRRGAGADVARRRPRTAGPRSRRRRASPQQRREPLAVERRRHHEEPQVARADAPARRARAPVRGRPAGCARGTRRRSRSRRPRARVRLQQPRQDALGDDLDTRARPDARLETRAEADRRAERARRACAPCARPRRARQRGAARAARCAVPPARRRRAVQRHERALAGARRRLEHCAACVASAARNSGSAATIGRSGSVRHACMARSVTAAGGARRVTRRAMGKMPA